MFEPNANKSKQNQDVITSSSSSSSSLNIVNVNDKADNGLMDDENNQNSTMIQVSGVVFDEMSSPSSLSFHSHSSKKAQQGNYKSSAVITNSVQQQQHQPFENIHNPSQGAFPKDGSAKHSNFNFVPSLLNNNDMSIDFVPPSLISKQKGNDKGMNFDLIQSVGNDNDINMNNNNNNKQFKQIWIPSKVISIKKSNDYSDSDDHKMDDIQQKQSIYNPWNSFSTEFDCSQVMLKICEILSNYSQDIEYKVNSDQYKIDGIIFMTDHNHVFFMISIYNKIQKFEQENNMNILNEKIGSKSQIEFVRKSGDSISFTRFCCDIKDIYFGDNGDNGDDGGPHYQSTIQQNPLLTPLKFINTLPNNDELNNNQSEEEILNELDTFNMDLNADNQYVADFMRMFCHSKLGKAIQEKHILNHEKIINTLIQISLNSMDICIVRGALIILISLIEKCQHIDICKQLLNEQNGPKLMYSIINILNNNDCDSLNDESGDVEIHEIKTGNKYIQFPMMIKKYAIRLLLKLTSFSNQINCFKNNQQFSKSFKNFQTQWIKQNDDKYHGFNHVIKQTMMTQIESTFLI
mmetsp:Transcript_40740/g.35954  ORF Transcript_40740/g.35954 Transcript_40740/m.35954 type:complete len:575 (+) Transcript_40740:50-1774(+)